METPLPQTLHGYERGHRLLAFAGDMSDAERSLIERLSDLSGYTPSGFSFTSYLTGYPCGRYYALACTWPDLTAERGGAVLTHTVLLPRALAAAAPSLAPLLSLHRKPSSASDRAPYQSSRSWDPAQVAREPFISPARARAALALVFFQPERPAVWIDVVAPLDGVAHIWRHLWPEARQDFSFCTLSFQPRQVEGRVFTFIGAPPESRGAFPTRGTTRAWWDQGQMGDPRWLSEGAIPALDQLVSGGPAWVKGLLDPAREAGLRPPRPHELPQLAQLMELRRAAPSRLSAARGAADLLAALWPDAAPSHPWWTEALGHLINRQPDAAISARPLWELVDLLGRPQLKARLVETALLADLCEQIQEQVAHRLTEAPAATAEGLSGLLTAIGDTPDGERLLKAVTDGAHAAVSRSTSPEQARQITSALLSTRKAHPMLEEIALRALRSLSSGDRVELLRAIPDPSERRALGRHHHAPSVVFDSWVAEGDTLRGLFEAANTAWEHDPPLTSELEAVLSSAPAELVVSWATQITDSRQAADAAHEAAKAARRANMTLASIAERCDGAVNGSLVFAVAASGANSEDVRSKLEWKPALALAILRASSTQSTAGILDGVARDAARSITEERLLSQELRELLVQESASRWGRELQGRAAKLVIKRLVTGKMSPEEAAEWFTLPDVRSTLKDLSRWDFLPGGTSHGAALPPLCAAMRRLLMIQANTLDWVEHHLVVIIEGASASALEASTNDLCGIIEDLPASSTQLELAAAILTAIRSYPPRRGWMLVERCFPLVYPFLEKKKVEEEYHWFFGAFWRSVSVPGWDKAKVARHWIVEIWIQREWPADSLLRLLAATPDGAILLTRLLKRARKVTGGEALIRALEKATRTSADLPEPFATRARLAVSGQTPEPEWD
ncbi:hypothetical protein L6R46_06640 [Myxococcota bacterium]|nr:hypothetical protein [Myxococcota bacterium]